MDDSKEVLYTEMGNESNFDTNVFNQHIIQLVYIAYMS